MKQGLLTTALLSAFSGTAQVAPLPPTGKWVLNFDDARCLATREYGSADKPLYLLLKPSPAGGIVQLLIARKGPKQTMAVQGAVTIADGRGEPVATSHLSWYEAKKSKLRLTAINLTTDQFDRLRLAQSWSIHAPSEFTGDFALSNMAPLGVEMDRCVADLKQVWNVVEPEPEGRPKPKPVAAKPFFRSEDYPIDARRADQTGFVALIFLVDEQGAVRDCTIAETSGIPTLDAQSCAVVTERGKYRPALGPDGKPIKSWTKYRIKWALPDRRR